MTQLEFMNQAILGNTLMQWTFAITALLLGFILLRLAKKDFIELLKEPTLQWLDVQRAQARVAAGKALWVDVRTASERSHRHLPDSLNIPMRDLHKRARELDPALEYICVCQTGRRSSAAAFVLSQYGLCSSILKDGMNNPELKL